MSKRTSASAIVDRVERRLSQLGETKAEFYKMVGVSSASFSQWRNDQYYPSHDTILVMADYLNVSDTWLLTGIEEKEVEYLQASKDEQEAQVMKLISQLSSALDKSEISPDEQRLLSIYRSAPEQGKAFLLNAADMVESAYLGKNNQSESVEAAS